MQKLIFLLCLVGILFVSASSIATPSLTAQLTSQAPLTPLLTKAAATIAMADRSENCHLSAANEVAVSVAALIETAEIDEDILPLTAPAAILAAMTHLLLSHATSPPRSHISPSLDRPPQFF